jgi:hypothetical protein
MDLSDKELKVLLQALYRFRGEVSGASQSEQNKLALVASVVEKIESKVGPLKSERTGFDREMEESLSVLKTGRMGVSKATKARAELDKRVDAPKVKGKAAAAEAKPRAGKAKKAATEPPKAKKASGPSKAGSAKTRS